jgi:hypothetical protein
MTLAEYFEKNNSYASEIMHSATIKAEHYRGQKVYVGVICGESMRLIDGHGETAGVIPLSYFQKKTIKVFHGTATPEVAIVKKSKTSKK